MLETTLELSDAVLVRETLAGNRRAFEGIVARYKTLVCSVAYSATGSITESEDLAQETFITAWKQLPQLREQAKLGAWLCGIARFTISKALRKQGREPSHGAEPLETMAETTATGAVPADRAISREEQAILWRAIEHIPAIYREPLILFYREQQSVEAVAEFLELSADAVKQRLSRGRKLLHQKVLALVEGGLARSNPGRAFTAGVIAALPAFLLPVQATAAAGTLTAQSTGKTAYAAGLGGALLAPLLAVFGTWIGYRADLESAGSPAESELTKTFYRRLAWGLGVFFAGFTLLMFVAARTGTQHETLLVGGFLVLGLGYILFMANLMRWWLRARRMYLAIPQIPVVKPAWEYRSRLSLGGMPLVHIRIGGDLRANGAPVRAWIAAGDTAFGGLFAFGGIAVAPLSIGGCAIGLLPFGGASVGVLALGGFSLGIWSFGGLAIGWQAFGACAIAWNAAAGAAAIANDFALGGKAFATQANNAIATVFLESQGFFRNASHVFRHHLSWLNLIWVLPMLVWWHLVRRAKAPQVAATR